MRALAATLIVPVASCASAPTAPAPPPQSAEQTKIIGSTSTGGRGAPFGDSAMTPYMHLGRGATSSAYGYSAMAPAKVGGGLEDGSANEQLYLRGLRGPNGEVIEYERQGSCCGFQTPSSSFGGLLDIYTITWKGADRPRTLYINMYDPGETLVPVGLTARND